MSNKRMNHVFNEMVVKAGRDIDTAELQFINGGVSATFFCAQQAIHATHAINNHDRMVEEIAELKGLVDNLKKDRSSAISLMSKSWQHNAEDYPTLLTRFVKMANRQFELLSKQKKENSELRGFVKKVSELEIETFNFETQGGDEDCLEYVCTDIVDDAVELLAKLNQEGGE